MEISHILFNDKKRITTRLIWELIMLQLSSSTLAVTFILKFRHVGEFEVSLSGQL